MADQVIVPDTTVVVTPPAAPERPAWLPENFKTPEDFAASYKELEKKVGTPPATATTVVNLSDPVKAATALSEKGLDFTAMSAEFLAEGKLSDASMASLKEKGFDQAAVDSYIKGQTAIADQAVAAIHGSVGGKETFDKVLEFTKTNGTAAEIEAYNKAINGGDYDTLKVIVGGLKTRMDSAFGVEPKLADGTVKQDPSGGYEDYAAYQSDLSNPLYKTNEGYRRLCDAKLARSPWAVANIQ